MIIVVEDLCLSYNRTFLQSQLFCLVFNWRKEIHSFTGGKRDYVDLKRHGMYLYYYFMDKLRQFLIVQEFGFKLALGAIPLSFPYLWDFHPLHKIYSSQNIQFKSLLLRLCGLERFQWFYHTIQYFFQSIYLYVLTEPILDIYKSSAPSPSLIFSQQILIKWKNGSNVSWWEARFQQWLNDYTLKRKLIKAKA